MSKKKLLQIIVPALSDDLRFPETFDYLVILQRFQDIQVTIVTDSLEKIEGAVKSKDRGGVELVETPKKGVYNAMNNGIILGHSKYHNFLNCGDIPVIDNYEKILDTLEFEEKHICCSFFTSSSGNEKIIFNKNPGWGEKHAPHQAYFFNNSKLKEKYYDESFLICADYFYIKNLKSDDLLFLDIPVVVYDLETGLSKDRPFTAIWETFLIEKRLGISIHRNIFFFLVNYLKNILIESIRSIGVLKKAMTIKRYINNVF